MAKKQPAILVGPFLGELKWELYRFSPYIIHLKKKNPSCRIIVYTRASRFDLYGAYADVLVSLKLKSNNKENQKCFYYKDFPKENYLHLSKVFNQQYEKKFNIIGHIYPKVNDFYYKLKWQFPRNSMDYDFKPRSDNSKLIQKFINNFNSSDMVFYNYPQSDQLNKLKNNNKYNFISTDYFFEYFEDETEYMNISFIGCIIELIKRCKFVLSDFTSEISLLSLLLKKPLITLSQISDDEIHLSNPYNTPVIKCDTLMRGFEYYENKF